MAQAVKFTKGSNGSVTVTPSGFTSYPSRPFTISNGDSLSADLTGNTFTIHAKAAPNGQLSFALAELDKAGSSPALVGTTTTALQLEIADNFFSKASSGGAGGGVPTAYATNPWNGSDKELLVTADTDIVTDDDTVLDGTFLFEMDGTGGWIVTLNGDDIGADPDPNAVTVFILRQRVDGSLYMLKDTSYIPISAPPPPDVTPPTISFEATGPNTIEWTASEAITGTLQGITMDNGSPLTLSNFTGSGTASGTITTAETMTRADTITFDITGSDLVDDSNNPLADDSGTVTNDILITLLDKVFSATKTPFADYSVIGPATFVIASDGGTNKAHLNNNSSSGGFIAAKADGVFTPGDMVHITFKGVNIVSGAPHWALSSAATQHVAALANGDNTYVVDTTGFANGDVLFQTEPNVTSAFYVREVIIAKE